MVINFFDYRQRFGKAQASLDFLSACTIINLYNPYNPCL